MSAVKIVTDSTADIPPTLLRELDIEIVPMYINVGDEIYRDGPDLDNEQYYRLLHTNPSPPTTSAPPTIVFEQTYRRLAHTHDAVISIHVSGHLSTAFKAAAQAREKLPPSLARIEVVDTHSASLGVGLTVIAAARMAKAGASVDEILPEVQHRVQHTHAVFFVDTIEYLDRSGRINLPPGMVTSMSRIKPLLLIDQGHIVLYERTRTRAKAIDGLFTFVEDFPKAAEIAVVYSTTPEDVEKVLDKVGILFPRDQVLVGEYGPSVGVHLGPGAMGIVVYEGEGN
jgi:DegV family protein with EDD domain